MPILYVDIIIIMCYDVEINKEAETTTILEKVIYICGAIQLLMVISFIFIYIDINSVSSHKWALNICIQSGMCHP